MGCNADGELGKTAGGMWPAPEDEGDAAFARMALTRKESQSEWVAFDDEEVASNPVAGDSMFAKVCT